MRKAGESLGVKPLPRVGWRRSLGFGLLGLAAAASSAAAISTNDPQPAGVGWRGAATPAATPAPWATTSGIRPSLFAPTVGRSSPSPSATSTAAGRQLVEDTYLRYWHLYSDALFRLDTARIAEVAAGEELLRVRAEVEGFRRRDRAVRVRVSHSYAIRLTTVGEAEIHDEITNRSFTVDPRTKAPALGPDVADLERDTFQMKWLGDTWKVLRSTRQRGER
jgi:hypothetical protein